jgi:hypothetical protein
MPEQQLVLVFRRFLKRAKEVVGLALLVLQLLKLLLDLLK